MSIREVSTLAQDTVELQCAPFADVDVWVYTFLSNHKLLSCVVDCDEVDTVGFHAAVSLVVLAGQVEVL